MIDRGHGGVTVKLEGDKEMIDRSDNNINRVTSISITCQYALKGSIVRGVLMKIVNEESVLCYKKRTEQRKAFINEEFAVREE